MTKQRAYQLRHESAGLCKLCNEPLATANYCLRHAVAKREEQRARGHHVRRNRSVTYRLQDRKAWLMERYGASKAKEPPRFQSGP